MSKPIGTPNNNCSDVVISQTQVGGSVIYKCYVSVRLNNIIKPGKIVFDELNLILRNATEMESHFQKLTNSRGFSFVSKYYNDETLCGEYDTEQIDENSVVLIKKEAA